MPFNGVYENPYGTLDYVAFFTLVGSGFVGYLVPLNFIMGRQIDVPGFLQAAAGIYVALTLIPVFRKLTLEMQLTFNVFKAIIGTAFLIFEVAKSFGFFTVLQFFLWVYGVVCIYILGFALNDRFPTIPVPNFEDGKFVVFLTFVLGYMTGCFSLGLTMAGLLVLNSVSNVANGIRYIGERDIRLYHRR